MVDTDSDPFPSVAAPSREPDEPRRVAAHCPVAVIESVEEAVRYRKAWSELQLLSVLGLSRPKAGASYHLLTGGEIDQISWIHVILRYVGRLDRLVMTTWKISADGCRDIRNLIVDDKVSSLSLFTGDRLDYRREPFRAIDDLSKALPNRLCFSCFPVHANVLAGINEAENFAFAVESSANCNINKRIEQACLTVSRQAYSFFNDYFSALEKRISDGLPATKDLRGKRAQAMFDL